MLIFLPAGLVFAKVVQYYKLSTQFFFPPSCLPQLPATTN